MTDDYCELCDLPLSTCVHGRPPPAPPAPAARKAAAAPRVRTARTTTSRPAVSHRWTPAEVFRPHILRILRENAGRLEADDLMVELEVHLDDVLTPGDRETSPQGGLRWHVATRKERKALIDAGLLVPAQPGVWELTPLGMTSED